MNTISDRVRKLKSINPFLRAIEIARVLDVSVSAVSLVLSIECASPWRMMQFVLDTYR